MVDKGYFLFILLEFTETFKLHGSFLHYSLTSVVTFTCSDPNYTVQQFGSQRLSISTFFPHPLPQRYRASPPYKPLSTIKVYTLKHKKFYF